MDIKRLLTGFDAFDPAKLDKSERADKTARMRRAQEGGQETGAGRGDTVQFSEDARLRTDAHAAASNAPDIRHDKVAAIKAQIAAGDYQIDTRKIASRVVQEDLEFFGR